MPPRRHKPDERDFLVTTLQAALDRASARIRELEAHSEQMAQRLAYAVARADHAELIRAELEEQAQRKGRLASVEVEDRE